MISDNRERSVAAVSIDPSTENSLTFSPRGDPEIYLDELHTDLSFVRGTNDERADFLKEEQDRIQRTFGEEYRATVKISTFYQAQVSAPVSSKRTRHHEASKMNSNTSDSLESVKKERGNSRRPPPSRTRTRSRTPIKLSTQTQQPLSYIPSNDEPLQEHLSDSTVSLDEDEKRSLSNASRLLKGSKKRRSPSTQPSKACSAAVPENNYYSQGKSKAGSHTISVVFKSKLPALQRHGGSKGKSSTERSTADEDSIHVPLSSPLPAGMDAKEKEKEYWRRQRRVFVYSRFITNEEGLRIAQSVYDHTVTSPTDRAVTSFQGNIANFRTKLRRILDGMNDKFQVRKADLTNDEEDLYQRLAHQVDVSALRLIWKHWIADPFVDVNAFYADTDAVNLLKDVTVKLIIIHFKEQFHIYTPRQARMKMRALDAVTRTLRLPDATEYA
ncbi:hypothetical protein BDF20DRAFT_836404 [Mycotypha africana]|uniref:uncharacterized protein n=1 Tax=Mycotypha africana TaxID=64632 RepID=UPI002301C553|nr:uncharacterized protein BDF20DRAFT_836404 [Mycotypha africana]KAI8977620.1 hypothetical protein BDF20DRAFT_836404 [Mycotypha africana]